MPSCACLLLVGVEHLVDRQAEEPCDRERQRQRRQVAAALDGDHRLARHAQRRRQFGLRQTLLGALLPDPVPHDVKVPLLHRDVKHPLHDFCARCLAAAPRFLAAGQLRAGQFGESVSDLALPLPGRGQIDHRGPCAAVPRDGPVKSAGQNEADRGQGGDGSQLGDLPTANRQPGGYRLSAMRVPPGPLQSRNFRLLLACNVTSVTGTAVAIVAIPFAVLAIGGSAADVGYVAAAVMVPALIFPLGGVVADRLPRHQVMMAANVLQAVAQAVAAALVLAGRARVWELVVLAFARGVGYAFYFPAETGLLPLTVPADQRAAAN